MASVEVEIAARKYSVACRDGEEEHLRSVAAIVDRKAQDAAAALGSLSEARQLLFASLLLADELKEHRSGQAPPPPAEPDPGRRRCAGAARRSGSKAWRNSLSGALRLPR